MSKKVVTQLKHLRSIRPSREWQVHTREVLLSQVTAQGMTEKRLVPLAGFWAYLSDGATLVSRSTIGVLSARPAVAIAAVAFLFSGSAVALIISNQSIPGESLYAVKKTREHIQVALATAPSERAQLELDLATERLKELESVSGQSPESAEKDAAILSLMETVNNNLTTATKNLDTIKTIGEPRKVATIARSVNKKAQEYEQVLSAVSSGQSASHINDAISKINETKTKTLEVIVDKKDSAGIPEEEVAVQIEEKIKQTQERVEKITVSIASVKDADGALLQRSDEAKRTLEEAKQRLERKDFKLALSKVSETDILVKDVEQKLEQENKASKNQETGAPERTKVSF